MKRHLTRKDLVRDVVAIVFFVALVGIIMYFVSKLRVESAENQTIGHAVSDTTAN